MEEKKNTLDSGVYHRCVLIITSRLEKVVLMPRERERGGGRVGEASSLITDLPFLPLDISALSVEEFI